MGMRRQRNRGRLAHLVVIATTLLCMSSEFPPWGLGVLAFVPFSTPSLQTHRHTPPLLPPRHATSTAGSANDPLPPSSNTLPPAPGPRPLPFLGNMLRFIKAGGWERYDAEMYRKYGKIAR
ncbi:Cytochrome P450 [Nannochloropsis gaditana]|uniref:Cytochrome P450 n=1 Tax=Nannochloropsis gaditana TaxID=72520 RepID=W7TH72_9STRA|nr:Cytochrome P450 [Nannochloropsis gaditana]